MAEIVLDVRRGRAERLRWCNCLALDGVVEANVRVEVFRRAAKAVDALRRIALEGAIVRYVYMWLQIRVWYWMLD